MRLFHPFAGLVERSQEKAACHMHNDAANPRVEVQRHRGAGTAKRDASGLVGAMGVRDFRSTSRARQHSVPTKYSERARKR